MTRKECLEQVKAAPSVISAMTQLLRTTQTPHPLFKDNTMRATCHVFHGRGSETKTKSLPTVLCCCPIQGMLTTTTSMDASKIKT
ncbi:hypothetical protein F2Q70_00028542 [Brassica cretica]|uniref:Uncharacterized protein n=1 Tax=Brassica cretica TaxID=69181 RepID=A0A8S9L8X7_BRACR|nr:hypothetical protein F2Q70_00028542 [Brassica cretica]